MLKLLRYGGVGYALLSVSGLQFQLNGYFVQFASLSFQPALCGLRQDIKMQSGQMTALWGEIKRGCCSQENAFHLRPAQNAPEQ